MKKKSIRSIPPVGCLLGLLIVGTVFGFWTTREDPQMTGLDGWQEME